jgi:hypothetical protein
MKRLLLAALLALPALLIDAKSAQAQCNGLAGGNCYAGGTIPAVFAGGPAHPHFPPFGCGGFCMGFLSRIHFHGPLYNYGPYSGYYPFEPYGPWTANLQYNAPQGQCGKHGLGGGGWGQYAVSTLKNVFHRVNPLANKCGGGLSLGKCGKHGAGCGVAGCDGSAGCASGGCATGHVALATPAQGGAVVSLPPTTTGVLTGQTK